MGEAQVRRRVDRRHGPLLGQQRCALVGREVVLRELEVAHAVRREPRVTQVIDRAHVRELRWVARVVGEGCRVGDPSRRGVRGIREPAPVRIDVIEHVQTVRRQRLGDEEERQQGEVRVPDAVIADAVVPVDLLRKVPVLVDLVLEQLDGARVRSGELRLVVKVGRDGGRRLEAQLPQLFVRCRIDAATGVAVSRRKPANTASDAALHTDVPRSSSAA